MAVPDPDRPVSVGSLAQVRADDLAATPIKALVGETS